MATIRKKGPGRWEARWYEPGPDGTLVRRSRIIYTSTWREANRAATALEQDRRSAADTRGGRTVADAVNAWIAHGGRRASPRSQIEVAVRARRHLLPRVGDIDLDDLTTGHLERLYADLRDSGLAAGTVRHCHWDLSGSLALAVRHGWIPRSPADRVELGPLPRKRPTPPDLDDVRAVLAVLDDASERSEPARQTALAVRIAAATGARLGEIAALRWHDVDWAGPALRFTAAATEIPGVGVVIKGTKTGTIKTIPIPADLAARLASHRDLVTTRTGPPRPGWTVLTGTLPDEPISMNGLKGRFARAQRAAGVKFRFHDLRHLAAHTWLEGGLTITETAALLGHRRASTTSDIYGHVATAGGDRRAAVITTRVLGVL